MSKIYKSIEELIGHTPLLEIGNIEDDKELKARVLVKLEYYNPAGSAKDRVAKKMLDERLASGELTKDSVIIEPTSGNTGIGLAAVAAVRGLRAIIVMPDSMSPERIKLMKAYGAEVVLTPGQQGMNGAIEKAEQLSKAIPLSFIAGQFENPANPKAHYETTGPEIFEDTAGEVDVFVAGVGTGGTITGTGRFLKEKKPSVKIIGVEPDTSAVLSGKSAGPHKLQGIGAGFIPKILDVDIMDEVMPVSADDAYETARLLARCEGILTGITSGAAAFAAIELAKKDEYAGKTIVALLPDTGARYLSGDLY